MTLFALALLCAVSVAAAGEGGWSDIASAVRRTTAARLFTLLDTSPPYGVSADEFRAIARRAGQRTEGLFAALGGVGGTPLSAGSFEAGLASRSPAGTVAARVELEARAVEGLDTTALPLSGNCSVSRLSFFLARVRSELGADPVQPALQSLPLLTLVSVARRSLGLEEGAALALVMKSVDVDKGGLQSMQISGRGACRFLAKAVCPELAHEGHGLPLGPPGEPRGYLSALMRGEAWTPARPDEEEPLVAPEDAAHFLSTVLGLATRDKAAALVRELSCGGGGLDAADAELVLAAAYAEAAGKKAGG